MVIIRPSEKRGSKKETSLSRQMAFGLMPIDIDIQKLGEVLSIFKGTVMKSHNVRKMAR